MLSKYTTQLLLCMLPLLMGFAFLSPQYPPPASESEQALRGAWTMVQKDGVSNDELAIQMVKILSDGHFMFAFYNSETQQFFSAGGGTYSYANGQYTENIDFHTIDPALAGTSVTFSCKLDGDKWVHQGNTNGTPINEIFQRVDKGSGSDLSGTWKQEFNVDAAGKRLKLKKHHKKLKILSGTRFQWVEYNSKKGKFISCGGGTYTLANQAYEEKLEFFSTDSTQVGKAFQFECKQAGDEWIHKEKALRGAKPLGVDEVWSRSDW
ncbi:MAG: hypothetical protein AAFY71_13235 [Bacteroidota bacterium]